MKRIIATILWIAVCACNDSRAAERNLPSFDSTGESPLAHDSLEATHQSKVDSTYKLTAGSSAMVRLEHRRCQPNLETDDGMMTLDLLAKFVAEIHGCDPFREYFTVDRTIRDESQFLQEVGPGVAVLFNLQTIAGSFRDLVPAFDNMPLRQRRAILAPAMKLVATEIVEYVHPSYLDKYLLNLDWTKDIDAVNPAWYLSLQWPDNRLMPIDMPGGLKLSKTDLWVRMFWRRRGETVFLAAKDAVKEATKK